MTKLLSDLKPSQSGKVIIISGEDKLKRRLYDMGITPGAEIVVHKFAPLGDPMQINLRGYSLSLRRDEARFINIDCTEA